MLFARLESLGALNDRCSCSVRSIAPSFLFLLVLLPLLYLIACLHVHSVLSQQQQQHSGHAPLLYAEKLHSSSFACSAATFE